MTNKTNTTFSVQRCHVVFGKDSKPQEILLDLEWTANSFPYFLLEWEDGAKLVIGRGWDGRREPEFLDMNDEGGPFSCGLERYDSDGTGAIWDAFEESEAQLDAEMLWRNDKTNKPWTLAVEKFNRDTVWVPYFPGGDPEVLVGVQKDLTEFKFTATAFGVIVEGWGGESEAYCAWSPNFYGPGVTGLIASSYVATDPVSVTGTFKDNDEWATWCSRMVLNSSPFIKNKEALKDKFLEYVAIWK